MLALQSDRVANSFEVIGREWFDRFSPSWSKGHLDRVKRQLEKDLYPWIGKLAVADVDAPTLLSCLRLIEKRGAITSPPLIEQGVLPVRFFAMLSRQAE